MMGQEPSKKECFLVVFLMKGKVCLGTPAPQAGAAGKAMSGMPGAGFPTRISSAFYELAFEGII